MLTRIRFWDVPCFFSDKIQIVRCSLFPDIFCVLTGSPGVSDVDSHGEAPPAQGGE